LGSAGRSFGGQARHLAEQCIGGIAAPLVLLWRHVGTVAESLLRLFAVTITGLRSLLADAAGFGVLACCEGARFTTMAGTSSSTGFFFRGGRL
jgi:hypothetical protein